MHMILELDAEFALPDPGRLIVVFIMMPRKLSHDFHDFTDGFTRGCHIFASERPVFDAGRSRR